MAITINGTEHKMAAEDLLIMYLNGLNTEQKLKVKFSWINWFDKDDVAEGVCIVSDETGYDFDFLMDILEEGMDDGQTIQESFMSVAAISYEKDW